MDEVKLLPCVTKASLQFADGSMVAIDFERGNSIDEALSKLRLASTGEAPIVTDEVVERVARALFKAIYPTGTTWEDWERHVAAGRHDGFDGRDRSRELARAAIAAMPTIDQDGGDHEMLTASDVRQMIAEEVLVWGTQRAAAQKIGVSDAYLSDVLLARREPGPKIAAYFDLEAMTLYRAQPENDQCQD